MIHVIRLVFLLLVSIVAAVYLWATLAPATPATTRAVQSIQFLPWSIMVGGVVLAFLIITLDILIKRKNLSLISGLLFGLLVGIMVSLAIGNLIDHAARVFEISPNYNTLIEGSKLIIGLMLSYLFVSFILQTKDDFRFIIPYVEFSRATKGPRPVILDTSVIIDGRIADLAATGMFESPVLVPRFVLLELQTVADSGDSLKRRRGRRGLDVLEKLKQVPKLELHFWEGTLAKVPASEGVDQKLVALAQQENGRLVTNDFNLNKIAGLHGVDVININLIAEALKPVVLPGETMKVRIIKPGENPGQGVGYLEDGTMVVVEAARDKVGNEVELVVTNAIQNPAGKMIFGRMETKR